MTLVDDVKNATTTAIPSEPAPQHAYILPPVIPSGNAIAPIVPSTFEEAQRIAKMVLSSGVCPYGVKTIADATVIIMHGLEIGLPPMQALQSIAVINGKPALYGDGLLAVVYRSNKMERMTETIRDRMGENPIAVCTVWRVGGQRVQRMFSRQDAQVAGLWGKRGRNGEPTPWITYPYRMLQMRARGFAMRDCFPDVLRGLISVEEAQDVSSAVNGGGGNKTITAPPPPPDPLPADAVVWEETAERPATAEDVSGPAIGSDRSRGPLGIC